MLVFVADDDEHEWIVRTCRKGWDEYANYKEKKPPSVSQAVLPSKAAAATFVGAKLFTSQNCLTRVICFYQNYCMFYMRMFSLNMVGVSILCNLQIVYYCCKPDDRKALFLHVGLSVDPSHTVGLRIQNQAF